MNPPATGATVTGPGVRGQAQPRQMWRSRGRTAERSWAYEAWSLALFRGAAVGVAIGTGIAIAIVLDRMQTFDGLDFVVAAASAGSPLIGALAAAVAMPGVFVARWHRAAAGAGAAGLAQCLVIGMVWIAAAFRGSGLWDLWPAFTFVIPAGVAGGLLGLFWMNGRGTP